jgi:hypothetical protein
MPVELANFMPETGAGPPTVAAPPGECVLSWGTGAARRRETRDLPEQMRGLPAAGSRPAIAAATGLRVRAARRTAELMRDS